MGLGAPDDAAVYRLNADQAIVSTTDFFPPVIDDPYDFGQVAAANALSDIYAMGGEPLFAINLVAFPDDLDYAILTEILRGGADKVKEAGAIIAGGHSVIDREPKYGLAVTGVVHPDRIVTKGGAQPGDLVCLTKLLGTGTLTTAHKRGEIAAEHLQAVIHSMTQLNRDASRAAVAVGVRAMTDVTGFGLVGHTHEVAHLSGHAIRLEWEALPWINGAELYAERDIFPGGETRNEEFYSPWTTHQRRLEGWQRKLLYDPQTSGGLLVFIPSSKREAFFSALAALNQPVWTIGEVIEGDAGRIVIA